MSMNSADGKTEVLGEKTYPSATLSTTNPTWIGLGLNPGLRRGTALNRIMLNDVQLPASVVLP
jgi:hypothetical protein